jgi:hypothetical protein
MTRKHTARFPFLFLHLSSAAALTVLVGSAGHAQSILLTAPPTQPGTATTATYPVGATDPNATGDFSGVDFIDAPFTVAAGSTNVTFTATNATPSKSFESFTNDGSFDFPGGTQLVDTAVGDNNTTGSITTGPLLINFNSGVSAFGLNAQDTAFDSETFTFTVFTNGSTTNGTTFMLPTYDNTVDPSGKSVFLGAQAVGSAVITSVLISSQSLAVNDQGQTSTAGSNDFYFGPLAATPAAVPETSSVVSFGLLLGLGGALAAVGKRNRKERKTI